MGGNGYSNCFFNSPQNFSTRECAHRNNDTQKICIFIQRPLINIHCNIKDRQILCKLEYGCPFSVFVNLYRKNKFYFYSTSKYIFIPVQSNHPNIIQYYILPEKNKHLSLFLCKSFEYCTS